MQVPVLGRLLIILICCSPAFQISYVLILQLHHLQGDDNAL